MKRNEQRNDRRRKIGSVIVETALILPMLMALTLGIVQYGIILNASNALTQIARESARAAALSPYSDVNIRANVKAQCAKTAILYSDISNVGIDPPLGSRVAGGSITVSLTYPMSRKVFLPSTVLGAPIFNTTVTQSGSYLIEGAAATPTP